MALSVADQGRTSKRYLRGTHRALDPAETLARLNSMLPVFGITRVADLTGLDRVGIPVVGVSRPNSRSLSVSQGKGLTVDAARASGLMEAIELHHAERIKLPLKFASFDDLRFSQRLADPSGLPALSTTRFHPDLRLLWIEGVDILRSQTVSIPYELVSMDFTLPLPPGAGCFVNSSNGLASGNHVVEAMLHGLCEVVERDAAAVWRTGRKRMEPDLKIDPDSVDDDDFRMLWRRLDSANIAVGIWEITSDIGLPVFWCAIADRPRQLLHKLPVSIGMGCHPSARIALLRAVTEAAQSRLTLIAGSRDDISQAVFQRNRPAIAAEETCAWLDEKGPRRFDEAPSFESETFEEDLGWVIERLTAADVESIVVVDLTDQRIGLPVVRVVIPGLEAPHDLPGYVAGRRALGHRAGKWRI